MIMDTCLVFKILNARFYVITDVLVHENLFQNHTLMNFFINGRVCSFLNFFKYVVEA